MSGDPLAITTGGLLADAVSGDALAVASFGLLIGGALPPLVAPFVFVCEWTVAAVALFEVEVEG